MKSLIRGSLEYYKEALFSINKAIKIDPENPNFYTIKSQSLKGLRRYKDALINCEQGIKIDSKHYFFRQERFNFKPNWRLSSRDK